MNRVLRRLPAWSGRGVLLAAAIALTSLAASSLGSTKLAAGDRQQRQDFDLVIAGGRVLDPESAMDSVRSAVIRDA
jgi:hypothetical protein